MNGILPKFMLDQLLYVSANKHGDSVAGACRLRPRQSGSSAGPGVLFQIAFIVTALVSLAVFPRFSLAGADWSTITKTNSVATLGYASGLALSADGRYVYIADDDGNVGMDIVDLLAGGGPAIVGSYDGGFGNALDVVVNDTHAFIAGGIGGLHVVDISDPTNPQQSDTLVFAYNGYSEFQQNAFGLTLDGNTLAVAHTFSGVTIVDVSDPTDVSATANFDTPGTAYDVAMAGGNFLVADLGSGLQIFDSGGTSIGEFNRNALYAHQLTLSSDGQTAFVSGVDMGSGGGVWIIDISTPSSPQLLGTGPYATEDAHEVVLSSDESLAFIADDANFSGEEGGLIAIDVSNPASPTLVGRFASTSRFYGVVVSSDDSEAYVVDINTGLEIFGPLAVTYTVSATAGTGGSASCSDTTVESGGSSTCTATADSGYEFDSWTGACAGQGATCSLTNITSDKSSAASFTEIPPETYTVSATAGTGGSASCSDTTVESGGSSTCTATADSGYEFDSWTGACAGQGATCSLTNITSDKSSAASFTEIPPETYTVSATAEIGRASCRERV